MLMLYYVPLEPYPNRYTEQWCRAQTGWLERNWLKYHVNYTRIDPKEIDVVDVSFVGSNIYNPQRRYMWAIEQTKTICNLIYNGTIQSGDTIYFDDFWHPGLDAIAFALRSMNLHGGRVWLACFCHAQSVDKYDFMTRMGTWVRDLERTYMNIYDYVFVNSPELQDRLNVAFPPITCNASVHVVGHVFSSEEVLSRLPDYSPFTQKREHTVVFASRWDDEKQPDLFLDVVNDYYLDRTRYAYDDVQFVVASGQKLSDLLPQNKHVKSLFNLRDRVPNLTIHDSLSKEQYYGILSRSAVQLSTSLQDWISFCLLEAVTYGCIPVYPNFRSFPDAFGKFSQLLYPMGSRMQRHEIVQEINMYIQTALQFADSSDMISKIDLFNTIVLPHNSTWQRMLNILQVPYHQD